MTSVSYPESHVRNVGLLVIACARLEWMAAAVVDAPRAFNSNMGCPELVFPPSFAVTLR